MEIVASIRYNRYRQIGAGQGMNSIVYVADDPQLGGDMVVKEIAKSDFGNDPSIYFEEARATFKASHKNVVEIRYACETPTHISLAMPHYRKGSLLERIGDRPLPVSEVHTLMQGVLMGLGHIHTVGYVHLDIKPENILLSDQGIPMVADFGQARRITNGVARISGTPVWIMPPETVATGTATVLSDVYQAGLLMYTALNGNNFVHAQRAAPDVVKGLILRGKYPDRKSFLPHVPKRLRTIVRTALQVEPSRRYRSASDMADALSRAQCELNWCMKPVPEGGRIWRVTRPGKADLVVEQVRNGEAFDVCTHTEQANGERRARGRTENWRYGLSDAEALDHLQKVFEHLRE